MKKTIISLIFVSTLALCAGAGEFSPSSVDFTKAPFREGTNQVYLLTDACTSSGHAFYWRARTSDLRTEARIEAGPGDTTCLYVDSPMSPTESLVRSVASRSSPRAELSPVMLGGDGCQALGFAFDVSLPVCMPPPRLGTGEKMALWLAATADGLYELHVSAGAFVDDFRTVRDGDFWMTINDASFQPSDRLHNVAVRTIPDVTDGLGVLGFTVALEGRPVTADEGCYVLADGFDLRERLNAEARVLCDRRQLFLARTPCGSDSARQMSGLAFRGRGHIGSIVTDSEAPVALSPETVLTLRWDDGVKTLAYSVDGGELVTLSATALANRRADIALGADGSSSVSVTATYRTEDEYSGGAWEGRDGCRCEGTTFVCDGSGLNPVALVNSYRKEVSLDGRGVRTFAEALRAARAQGAHVIKIDVPEFVPSNVVADAEITQWERAFNCLYVTPEDAPADAPPLTIDLNGNTIRGGSGRFAVIENVGGNIVICDSSSGGTGRIVPAVPFAGDATDSRQVAVHNKRSKQAPGRLLIEAGIFDGAVVNEMSPVEPNVLEIAGGEFISTNSLAFEHQAHVVDAGDYFVYSLKPSGLGYWSKGAENAFVWIGEKVGATAPKWNSNASWRNGRIPGKGDLAVFPWRATPWEVSVAGASVGGLWLDGDVALTGSGDFSDAEWLGSGRVSGSATLKWVEKAPVGLAGRLDLADWTGTIRIERLARATRLEGFASWGNEDSQVVFAGVNGYFDDHEPVPALFTLKLVQTAVGSESYGWKNPAGFSGGSVIVAKLTGDGDFTVPHTPGTVTINQEIRFLDVIGYTGRFDIHSKRIGIGERAPAYQTGSISYSEDVVARSGLGWLADCVSFGTSFTVIGSTTDVLVSYSDSALGVDAASVWVSNGTSVVAQDLWDNAGKICFKTSTANDVNGRLVRAVPDLLRAMKANAYVRLNAASGLTIDGHEIRRNGETVSTIADYYDVSSADGAVVLSLNANAVPVIGAFGDEARTRLEADEDFTWVIVTGTRRGLWYHLQFCDDLSKPWETVCSQLAARDGEDLGLYRPGPMTSSGFYRVAVTDRELNEEAK